MAKQWTAQCSALRELCEPTVGGGIDVSAGFVVTRAVEFGGRSRSADPQLMLFTEYDTILAVLVAE